MLDILSSISIALLPITALPLLVFVPFSLCSLVFSSIFYVTIPSTPFLISLVSRPLEASSDHLGNWARGNGRDPRSSHVSSHVSCQVGRWVIVRQELNLRVSDLSLMDTLDLRCRFWYPGGKVVQMYIDQVVQY